jgi:hypothetical protein
MLKEQGVLQKEGIKNNFNSILILNLAFIFIEYGFFK